ncbi:RBBP9/YdeN family alpha/beta hydrolase [Neisseria sp. Ec49-e6-T10]|uniref:RBBP9/YdeN family alpha/beta hydrolase n=1 Tax=Neisseria sp. Ec49-e6-T10 TaxID=3140744 RepID=UPI003EBFA6E1
MLDLEEMTLLAIMDEDEPTKGHWLRFWQRNYPLSQEIICSAHKPISEAIASISQTITKIETKVFIVTHGFGGIALLEWAKQASLLDQKQICSSLVAAPTLKMPLPEHFYPITINFPMLIVGSNNDTLCSLSCAQDLANKINTRFYNAGNIGHINAQSNIGSWEQGMRLMQALLLT